MAKAAVILEVGTTKVFASALDWPGWCRSGRTEEAAISALADYEPRYRVVADQAGIALPAALTFDVVEKLPGDMTTNFGAPGMAAEAERRKLTATGARRQAALVAAAWWALDSIAATAPAELRKGPRGGGRDRDKMLDHVLGAEVAYARKIGVKRRQPALGDIEAIEALREAIIAVLAAPTDGSALVEKGWPARYAARRIAWHVLDHGWEMQDRTDGAVS